MKKDVHIRHNDFSHETVNTFFMFSFSEGAATKVADKGERKK